MKQIYNLHVSRVGELNSLSPSLRIIRIKHLSKRILSVYKLDQVTRKYILKVKKEFYLFVSELVYTPIKSFNKAIISIMISD